VRTLRRCESQAERTVADNSSSKADGFLYKNVPRNRGTLVQVGQGKIAAEDIGRFSRGKDRRLAGMTAPAQGWYCIGFFIKPDERVRREYRSGRTRDPAEYRECGAAFAPRRRHGCI